MTRDEAIYLLKSIVTSNPNDRVALDMAVYDMGIVEELCKERDAAMDGFVEWEKSIADSHRPEIIRCHECVYWMQNTVRQNSNDAGWWNEAMCERHSIIEDYDHHEVWPSADWYCADAERRTE